MAGKKDAIVCFDPNAAEVSEADLKALLDPTACEARWAAGKSIRQIPDPGFDGAPHLDDPWEHCGCGQYPCACGD